MCLSITTTIASEWLNSLVFHDDSRYITANEQTTICAGNTDKICHMTIIYFAQFLEVLIHY